MACTDSKSMLNHEFDCRYGPKHTFDSGGLIISSDSKLPLAVDGHYSPDSSSVTTDTTATWDIWQNCKYSNCNLKK